MLRDILTAEIPLVLHRDIYASAAILGIIVYLLLQQWGMGRTEASAVGMMMIAGVRIAAMLYHWRLPSFQLRK